jgi:translation initiation factor IF-2
MADKANTSEAASGSQLGHKGNGAPKITKMDAVKKALATLGKEAKPTDIQSFVRAKFGIVMTTDHISTCKGDIARKAKAAAQGGKAAPKPAPKHAAKKPAHKPAHKAAVAKATAPAKPAAPKPAAHHGGISLPDIRLVKDLVGRVGAGELRSLIDLLAR